MNLRNDDSRSKHILVSARELSLGYGRHALFAGVNIDLREGEALESCGRNGAGKTTVIKALLAQDSPAKVFAGELTLDKSVRVGVYEQEVSPQYFKLKLRDAIEQMYLDRKLSITESKVRGLAG